MAMSWRMRSSMWLRLVRPSTSVPTLLRRSTVMYRSLRLLWRLPMKIWNTVRVGRRPLRLVVVTSEIVRVSILSTCWLGHVWHDLHAARNHAGRPSTTCCISGCRWSAKSLSQLFHKCLPDVVGSNMDSVCDAKNDKRPLGRQSQA